MPYILPGSLLSELENGVCGIFRAFFNSKLVLIKVMEVYTMMISLYPNCTSLNSPHPPLKAYNYLMKFDKHLLSFSADQIYHKVSTEAFPSALGTQETTKF